jgi:hypothetical protein
MVCNTATDLQHGLTALVTFYTRNEKSKKSFLARIVVCHVNQLKSNWPDVDKNSRPKRHTGNL